MTWNPMSKLSAKHEFIAANERGMALATALIFLAVLTILSGVAITTTLTDTQLAGKFKADQRAQFIAEAGIQHALGILAKMTFQDALDGSDNKIGNPPHDADNGILPVIGDGNYAYGGGTYRVRVTNNTETPLSTWIDRDMKVIVRSTGTFAGVSRTIEVLITKKLGNIRGAITTNGKAGATGNLTIDGRDHEIDGTTVIPNSGVFGVSTRMTYDQSGSNAVGGTSAAKNDTAPTKSYVPAIIEQNATWPQPMTPDDFLDLPAGTLKQIAIDTGKYFSGTPTGNLSGVTYVEGDWANANINGEGILVLHNVTTTAILDKVAGGGAGGTFKGLIITDRIDKIHGTVIGAVTVLTSLGTTQVGTGNGDVVFSRAALDLALVAAGITPTVLTWRDGP